MNENKFDGKGKIYDRYRPRYSDAFIEYIYGELGTTSNSVIADIGSGTGILTKQLLDRGSRVLGVEPNADMRGTAERYLAAYDKFVSVAAPAENTGLEDRSVDLVTVAQAFHWFDKEKFKAECRRILKPNGRVVLVWNDRDESCDIVKANKDVNRKYCPQFKGFSGGLYEQDFEGVLNAFFDGEYDARNFANPQTYDESAFIGRNLSGSYALKQGAPRLQRLHKRTARAV